MLERPGFLRTPKYFAADDGGGGGGPAAGGAPAGGPAAGGPAAGGGAADPGAAAGGEWHAGFAPEHKALVEGKGWVTDNKLDVAKMVGAYANLEGLTGRSVVMPGKDAKPEEVAAFYNKLGRPESPDKYDLKDFKVPDGLPWNDNAVKALLPKFHARGLTQAQVAGAMQDYAEIQHQEFKAREANAEKVATEGAAALKAKWGPKFDANLDLANRGVRTVFGDKAAIDNARGIQLADGTYLLDHPGLAEAMMALGSVAGEGGGAPGAHGGNAGGGAAPGKVLSPTEADAEIQTLQRAAAADKEHPYFNRKHPDYKATQERLLQLYAWKNAAKPG